MASKKRKSSRPGKSAKSKPARPKASQGLSGNPQRRAEQLHERAEREQSPQWDEWAGPYDEPAAAPYDGWRDVTRLPDFTPPPAAWWGESHAIILDRVRAADWPGDLPGVQALAGEIIGGEFHDRIHKPEDSGLIPDRWLDTLIDAVKQAIQDDLDSQDGHWEQLWTFLYGTCSIWPGARPAVESVASLLAARDLVPAPGLPVAISWPAGEILSACDAYGTRALIVASYATVAFEEDGTPVPAGGPESWYAWDVDWCAGGLVMAAGPRQGPAEALAEWRDAVGPAAGAVELSPCDPRRALGLLDPALSLGTFMQEIRGGEPLPLMREYFRLHHRAVALDAYVETLPAEKPEAVAPLGWAGEADDDLAPLAAGFLKWLGEQDESVVSDEVADAAEDVSVAWQPFLLPEGALLFSCSPARIKVTGAMIREDYSPVEANAALQLFPQWVAYCMAVRPVDDQGARLASEREARAQAALLIGEDDEMPAELEFDPFARREY